MSAQAQAQPGATLVVTVTTQSGSVLLPGAAVALSANDGRAIATIVSDDRGQARFIDIVPGRYILTTTLSGFDDIRKQVTLAAGTDLALPLDLPLSKVAERVDVVGSSEASRPTIATTLAPKAALDSRTVDQLPVHDRSVLAALKLIAGIIDGPGGVSIKGGRPNQSALQIGMASLTDPTTGTPLFRLPADAVDSVEVLANPYAVEFGRFSSGLTVVNTRRGGDAWRMYLNSPDLSFRTDRNHPFEPNGIESFGPRIGFGGPLVKDRLFLEESAQFRYEVSELWSRPEDDTRVTKSLSAFTRLDAVLTPDQMLTASFNFFPSRTGDATLSTFNNPDMTADVNDGLLAGIVSARSVLTPWATLESTLQIADFGIDVGGPGTGGVMELAPDGNTGTFYNQQHRQTDTLQWAEAATLSRSWAGVEHLFKFGGDVLQTAFTGTSQSLPVDIRREDGTLARRLTFAGPIAQRVSTTDASLFAQDRVQTTARLLVEAGGRVDVDGVLDRVDVTPRVGAVVLLDDTGAAALRGGYGLFFERTPSVVGAFDQFETTTDTRFAADGVTPLSTPLTFVHRTTGDLDTARSATWNLTFDDRFNARWSMRVALLRRNGTDELVVSPIAGSGTPRLLLSSDGRSSYSEAELTARYSPGPRFDVTGTYVRSAARADLNAYTAFFDNVRWPIVGVNAYAPTSSDAPNRFVGQLRATPATDWLLSSIVELRSGFPYSAVDDALDWVGPRNQAFRFPIYASVDIGVERRIPFFRWKPWIGVRVYNALDRFNPGEVQANLASPFFGTFYNSYPRQIRLQLRLDR